MAIYAIGDLHLSLAQGKTMDRFGANWENHTQKLLDGWIPNDNDYVLIAGDVSWALKPAEAVPDLEFVERLPGKKIMVKGNHDFWWGSTNKLNKTYERISFIKNNFSSVGEYAVCGTTGSTCPGDTVFQPEDMRLYKRETLRLQRSIDEAKRAGFNKFIILMHYPPTNDKKDDSEYLSLIRDCGAEHVIYGHLHGSDSFSASLLGMHEGTTYHLVSVDYLGFTPVKIDFLVHYI